MSYKDPKLVPIENERVSFHKITMGKKKKSSSDSSSEEDKCTEKEIEEGTCKKDEEETENKSNDRLKKTIEKANNDKSLMENVNK